MGELLAEENLPQAGTAESSGSLSWEIAPDYFPVASPLPHSFLFLVHQVISLPSLCC